MTPIAPCLLAVVAAWFAATAQAREIAPSELPAPVQRTLYALAQGMPVRRITQLVNGTRTIYLVELEKNNAINPQLRIAQDGELLPDPAVLTDPQGLGAGLDTSLSALGSERMLEGLPEPVRRTVREQMKGRLIADIDKESWQGRTVYEVEFSEDGPNRRIHVADDGSVVRGEATKRPLRDFFLGTQLTDTPAAVQKTVHREAAGRTVSDVDVDKRGGTILYEIEIRDPQSGTFELFILPDGRILKDSRTTEP